MLSFHDKFVKTDRPVDRQTMVKQYVSRSFDTGHTKYTEQK